MADTAHIMGWHHSANLMDHYLDGGGSLESVDVKSLLSESERARTKYLDQRDSQLAEAYKLYQSNGSPKNMSVVLQSKWFDFSVDKKTDWYFAIGSGSMSISSLYNFQDKGGFTYVTMQSRVDVFDRYNWDWGKSVKIWKFKITDAELGRLERVGLAKSFEVRGSWSAPTWTIKLPGRSGP